ncbi:MAG: hypothetical protein ACTSUO_03360 [Candidatus Thorarchaeota archaeon]
MSSLQPDEGLPRNVILLGLMYLLYTLVIPILALIMDAPDVPANPGLSFLSWLMLCLMPFEVLLIYIIFRLFSKRTEKIKNLLGPAALMYSLGSAPSIFAFVIGLTNVALRTIAILLGLSLSIAGFGLVFHLLPKLNETIKATNQ